jgi:hypothetical protein
MACGLTFEWYCIFLKAELSFSVDSPIFEKFIKLIELSLDIGDNKTWAGATDNDCKLLPW